MMFWDWFERVADSEGKNTWHVMIPETELEKTLLHSLLCEALGSIGLNGLTYQVDLHGMWRSTEEKRANGTRQVDAYFCELFAPDLEDDEDEAYSSEVVLVRQIEKLTLPDGTVQFEVRWCPERLTKSARAMSFFRSFLRRVGGR